MSLASATLQRTGRLFDDRIGLPALLVVAGYLLVACGVWLGLWGQDWWQAPGGTWEGPSARHWLGTNMLGQDIFQRSVASTATAFEIGMTVAVAATLSGALIGAAAGYFSHTWLDEVALWLMGTLDSVPFYLLVAALAFAMHDHALAMPIAMIAAFWTTTARLVRAEVMRLKTLEFIDAARAIGVHPVRIICRHLLPNSAHILLVQGTLAFVAAIKAEVVLSFLGIGTRGGISWGMMIAESAQEIIAGQFMNFIAASGSLFVLVMAFNLLADSLQDALEPGAWQHRARRHG